MYCLTDEQVDFILSDIRRNGVDMEDLQMNLLDHVCCIMEQTLERDDDFERLYRETIKQFYKRDLREIEEETINLLTFKNYYAMKKVMIACGAFSVAAFIGGSLFKVMHWQGASFLLIMALLVLCFIFLPLMVLLKTKESNNLRDKVVTITGAVTGILYTMSTLFAVCHWPGRTPLWISTVCFSMFVFIPTYFFTGIRRAETKLNTIITSVLLVGATGLLFTMLAIRPNTQVQLQAQNYMRNEQLLKRMQHNAPAMANSNMVAEINSTSDQIKALLLQQEFGMNSFPVDFERQHMAISDRINPDIVTNENAKQLFATLKKSIDEYNALQTDADNKVPVAETMNINTIRDYSCIDILNSITQMQMYVVSGSKGLALR